ncbi:MAG TPA: hypothetical protein VMT76_01275 [Puia sp.]|nr:hypothetical protein [Puia sp.]
MKKITFIITVLLLFAGGAEAQRGRSGGFSRGGGGSFRSGGLSRGGGSSFSRSGSFSRANIGVLSGSRGSYRGGYRGNYSGYRGSYGYRGGNYYHGGGYYRGGRYYSNYYGYWGWPYFSLGYYPYYYYGYPYSPYYSYPYYDYSSSYYYDDPPVQDNAVPNESTAPPMDESYNANNDGGYYNNDTIYSQKPPTPGPVSDAQGRTWIKPHWKHTDEGWIWIEGYWKKQQ